MTDENLSATERALQALPSEVLEPARRWLDRLGDDVLSAVMGSGPDGLAALLRIVVGSEYAAGIIENRGDWFVEAHGSGELERSANREELEQLAQARGFDDLERETFMRALRQLRNETLVRILWCDWIARVPLRQTLASLSDLAEFAIDAAVRHAHKEQRQRFGDLRVDGAAQPLVVLAMGKLGGRELNFSSDVDLIFAYPEEGATDGAKSISAHEYYTRIARRLVALLQEVTPDGFVYRVDTRLRPFGNSGPPVISFDGLEGYLQQHGRAWERYAYVKARVIHPSCEASADELMQRIIHPFVYRRYLDFGVFDDLRDMHAMVTSEVRRRELSDNIKQGPGGIREIEFIVQALQLVRGGSTPSLRTPELVDALRWAIDGRELTEDTAKELRTAYELLRRVENALQAFSDQQTHDLPVDAAARARLAFLFGMRNWAELDDALREARSLVTRRFEAIAIRDAEDKPGSDAGADYSALWAAAAPANEWLAVFRERGYSDAESLAVTLARFAESGPLKRVDATAGSRLQRFVPTMLSLLATADFSATTLGRVLQVVESVLRRSAYLALLNENRPALERLVEVCGRSQYLADQLANYPSLLDELIDPTTYKQIPPLDELRAELMSRAESIAGADIEGQVELLAEFKRAMHFRVAVADICGGLPLMKVSDRLTDIAELILSSALALAHREMVARYGQPRYRLAGKPRHASLGVVAYGKLGGIELSYGSDLDLVFLHDSRGEEQVTDGDRSIDNSVFFARVARRLVHFLTTQTEWGALYAIDTRLRPSGRSGLLVTSIDAFERYQLESAWTWEHQALLRARAVAGSSIVAREFERIRAAILRRPVDAGQFRHEVGSMRRRMRSELDKSSESAFDVKQGEGGIADIEFLVQYLVLANAAEHPALIHYTDNIRQLGTLVAAKCLEKETADALQSIYRDYRAVLHRQALGARRSIVDAGLFQDERAQVIDLWRKTFGDDG